MLIPDVNLLIYAYDTSSPRHETAKAWWEQLLRSSRDVGLSWVVIMGFLRIMTNPRIQRNPMEVSIAILRIRQWLAQPNVQIITPGKLHADILFGLLENLGTAANLTTDAHLAALAIEYRAELATTDADLTRFPGIRLVNPLTR